MPRLLIKLTKQTDAGYVISCQRLDGSVTWQKNRRGHASFFPVHDLTHYAVETELRHRKGFYGLLADGWDFDDFGAKWGRRKIPDDAEPSELIVGLLDADRFGVTAGGGAPATAADINLSACRYFEQRGVQGDAAGVVRLTEEQLARIRGRLRELRTRWECLPSGGTLELQFDVS